MIDHDNLEEFAEPAEYDAEFGSLDASGRFYLDLIAATGGPLLDIACGTGRIALPAARKGIEVLGVDIARAMLDRARSLSGGTPVEWLEADCRKLRVDRHFRIAVMAGHAFQQMLTEADQRALFRAVRAHLLPGGLFAFDNRNPRPADLRDTEGEAFWHRYAGSDGLPVDVSVIERWEPAAQLLHCMVIRRSGGRERRSRIALRYTDAATISRLLAEEGLAVEAQYGDWTEEPVNAGSPEIITLARRPA